MDIFLQVLQNFQNTAAFKTIFKNTILMSKSEHMFRQTTSFENCIYLKSIYFLYHNLILFSEQNYQKQTRSDQDAGSGILGPRTWKLPQSVKLVTETPYGLNVGPTDPLLAPPSKLRSRTHIKVFFHCFTYYILYEELGNFFKEILFYEQSPSHTLCSELIHYFLENFKF